MKKYLTLFFLFFSLILSGCSRKTAIEYSQDIHKEAQQRQVPIDEIESRIGGKHSTSEYNDELSTMKWYFEDEGPSLLVVYFNTKTRLVVDAAVVGTWAKAPK